MSGGLLDGLPLGIIMFVGMVVAVVWRKLGARRAASDFPELARELELEFIPSRYAGGQGRIRGKYEGYEVRIDPEDARCIAVQFQQPLSIDLRTYERTQLPPTGWLTIHTKDRAFDRFFQTRVASEQMANQLARSVRPSQYLEAFNGPYERQLKSLTVTSEGVKCQLDFGTPPHIPASAIRSLLPACIALAGFISGLPSDG